jgi:hypothetical protein
VALRLVLRLALLQMEVYIHLSVCSPKSVNLWWSGFVSQDSLFD